jgi:putative oxidoreductase
VLMIGIEIAVRSMLLALFLPFSALDKVINFGAAVAQAQQAVGGRRLATLLILAGLSVEVVMSAAILTGVCDRLAALILASYCAATALLWKRFWQAPDFKLRGPSRGRDTFWDFLKNMSVAGGFLLLALGSNASGVHRFFDHPLASSHPYDAAP